MKILQINSFNTGSTGNIMLNISNIAEGNGFTTFVAYPSSNTNNSRSIKNSLKIGNRIDRNMHMKLSYLTGYNGCFSKVTTFQFLKKINKINPDIIHLHNLHNSYINIKMLFDYIKERNVQVIWTLHDCWPFTGQCTHFTMAHCEKWKTGCFACPLYKQYPASNVDRTEQMYSLKKEWFNGVKNLTLVTPSQWLADKVKDSFLNGYPIKIINNGIDLNVFKPTSSNFRNKYNLQEKRILLGVANPWSKRKGLDIFIDLSKKLNDNYKIVLVGLSEEQSKGLPSNILGLPKTESQKELAEIYTTADIFINPSREETMGLVTIEAIACGTPVIVSNSTAVPEMVGPGCGIIVNNNSDEFYQAIISSESVDFRSEDLQKWVKKFDKNELFKKYIKLYQ